MKALLHKHHRLIFYGTWLLLTSLQAAVTELQDDEAYYWVYSKFLSWGYFDHPPMTAILIKTGSSLLPGEAGVRIVFVLLNLLTLMIAEKLTERKNNFLFYSLALTLAVLQLTGFFAVPDTALIFFTALFFWQYRKFIALASWKNSLLLGLTIALLFYTKYQAILIVLFTLFSNLRLIKNSKAYLACLFALLLFLPHLFWQWNHDWVSFRYHLFESNVDVYRITNSTDYILGQIILAGPIAGIILLPVAFSYRCNTYTERAMKFTLIGTLLFFFFSSFRGKVEPNWTSASLVPLLVLSHQALQQRINLAKWVLRLLPLTILLVMLARITMAVDILPVKTIQVRFHGWKKWPLEVKQKTMGLPVVFSNSYQRASKYWFYTGQITYSQNHVRDHRNNYNFWPIEEQLLGKPVYFMDIYGIDRFTESIKTPFGELGYRYDSACNSMARIQFLPEHSSYTIKAHDSLVLKGKIELPAVYGNYISSINLDIPIKLILLQKKTILKELELPFRLRDILKKQFEISIALPVIDGECDLIFSIEMPGYNPTHNSKRIRLKVNPRSS